MPNLVPIKKIPTLDDLYNDVQAYNDQQDLMLLLNQKPKDTWLKVNPMTKLQYMPIGRVEYLLNMIFPQWNVEVLATSLLANSVAVTVRLHVVLPNGEPRFYDGVGAAPLQTDKGAGAIDFNQIKSAAVQMALPAAKSFAIKDAADHIGKLFGKDINREHIEQHAHHIESSEKANNDNVVYEFTESDLNLLSDAEVSISQCDNLEKLTHFVTLFKDKYKTQVHELVYEKFVTLCQNRKVEIVKPKK